MLEFFLLGKSLNSYNLSKLVSLLFVRRLLTTILFLLAYTKDEMILLTFIESFFDCSLFYLAPFLIGI
jgi:hypothetical protein